MSSSGSFIGIVAACTLLAPLSRAGDPPSFTGLGDLPGGADFSRALGVSADGKVVCGYSNSAAGDQAFLWTAAGGMVSLGDLPGGGTQSHARGVSADGSTIVGDAESANGVEAFRWTAATGMVGLGDLVGAGFHSIANAVNADGTVIVGQGTSTLAGALGTEAWRWTTAGGMKPLGDLPGGAFSSAATGVSADGLRVCGYGSTADSGTGTDAFAWWSGVGMFNLDHSFGASSNSKGLGISPDGVFVAGTITNALGSHPAGGILTETGTTSYMGLYPALGVGEFLAATRTVLPYQEFFVGRSVTEQGSQAVLQRHSAEPEYLQSVLTDLGLDLTGWMLESATALSPDAVKIAGYGTNPAGKPEAWVADLGNVWTDVGGGLAGVSGVPVLTGKGEGVYQHGHLIEFTGAKPLAVATLVLGFSALNAPFKGGLLVPAPSLVLPGWPVDANGEGFVVLGWPHVPSGFSLWLQYWIPDAAAVKGFSATNGIMATAP